MSQAPNEKIIAIQSKQSNFLKYEAQNVGRKLHFVQILIHGETMVDPIVVLISMVGLVNVFPMEATFWTLSGPVPDQTKNDGPVNWPHGRKLLNWLQRNFGSGTEKVLACLVSWADNQKLPVKNSDSRTRTISHLWPDHPNPAKLVEQ